MKLYLATCEQRIVECRGWALGLYAEAVVAVALGAEMSPGGADDADLRWAPTGRKRPISVQVRACHLDDANSNGRFGIVGRDLKHGTVGQLWVFARHLGDEHSTGWTFATRTARELDRKYPSQKTVSWRRLAGSDEWVDISSLRDAALPPIKTS